MQTKEQARRVAVLTALRDAIDEIIESERLDLVDSMIELNETLGVKAIDVELPNGEIVASASVSVPNPKAIVENERQFLEWVKKNHPTEIVESVRDSFKKALLENTQQVHTSAVHGRTGEVIDGVSFRQSTHRMTLRFKKDGRALVAEAYNRGELDAVVQPLVVLDKPAEIRNVAYSSNESLGDSPANVEAVESQPSGALGG